MKQPVTKYPGATSGFLLRDRGTGYLRPKATYRCQGNLSVVRSANILFFFAAFATYYLIPLYVPYAGVVCFENVGYTKDNGIHLPSFWKLLEIIYIPSLRMWWYRTYISSFTAAARDRCLSNTRLWHGAGGALCLIWIVLLLILIPAIIISLHENLLYSYGSIRSHTGGGAPLALLASLCLASRTQEPLSQSLSHASCVTIDIQWKGRLVSTLLPVPALYQALALISGVWMREALRLRRRNWPLISFLAISHMC
jgi:hypothetical protein